MIDFGINNTYKVIPNVVDTDLFQFKPKKNPNSITQLLHISNLKDEHKNATGILNVIKKLSLERTDFCLTLAGDGDVDAVKVKAEQLNIPKGLIKFEKEKTQKEVAELMNQSDFFILFSNYETFSIVIAESWASGLPVIASKCGGLTEHVNNKNGISIAPKDEEMLIKAITNMIDNYSSYDPKEINALTSNQYSFSNVSKQFLEIYKTVLKH